MKEKLHAMALSASEKAHAPYSNYHVGAALVTKEGAFHSGCNIENASFPEGWCAETSAIAHMIMAGDCDIEEIAVYCDQVDKITPCGGCRQRISEFGNAQTLVHLCDEHKVLETVTLGELLPKAFDM